MALFGGTNRLSVVASLSAAALVFGCIPKKGSDSTNKSLDNLAAGQKITDNDCKASGVAPALLPEWQGRINFGTNLKTTVAKDVQDRYVKKVEQYLSAVPQDIQRAFLAYGGEILLSDVASERCGQAFRNDPKSLQYVSEAATQIDSCFIYANGVDGTATAGKAVFAIYHQINANEIIANSAIPDANEKRLMHGGVRSFGLLFSQFYAKLSPLDPKDLRPQAGRFKLEQVDTFAMSNVKEQIANRFLLDVAKSKRFKLENLEALLGKGSAKAIRDAVIDPATNGLRAGDVNALKPLDLATYLYDSEAQISPEQRQVRVQRMKDFAFGDAFDSRNCSDATRKVLKDDFDLTEAIYSQVDPALSEFARMLNQPSSALTASQPASKQGSLRLADVGNNMNLLPTQGLGGAGGLLGMLFQMFKGAGGSAAPGGIGGLSGITGSAGGLGNNRPVGGTGNTNSIAAGSQSSGSCASCASSLGDGATGCQGGSCAGSGTCATGACSSGSCGTCSGGSSSSGGSDV